MDREEDGLRPIIEAYKANVDRSLLRDNLRKSPEERLRALMDLVRTYRELRLAGQRLRWQRHGRH